MPFVAHLKCSWANRQIALRKGVFGADAICIRCGVSWRTRVAHWGGSGSSSLRQQISSKVRANSQRAPSAVRFGCIRARYVDVFLHGAVIDLYPLTNLLKLVQTSDSVARKDGGTEMNSGGFVPFDLHPKAPIGD